MPVVSIFSSNPALRWRAEELIVEGRRSVKMVAGLRECFPEQCFVWFSNLDFVLFSIPLETDYFGSLPLTEDKFRTALRNSMRYTLHHTPLQTKSYKKSMAESRFSTIPGRIAKVIQLSGFV